MHDPTPRSASADSSTSALDVDVKADVGTFAERAALEGALEDRYQVVRELGRGAMGIVYLARDTVLERPVAIKLLPPQFAGQQEFRDRFLRESRTVAALFHPHIVPIHAVEESGDLLFYVMGYVDGETLSSRVARVGKLPQGEVSRILQEAAWALAHAHERDIVHRDVKPDNILIERATGRVLITDFGIARIADSTITAMGTSVGTPQFMSPEQAAGDAIDQRSDLYCLGLVGFFALTGAPPFVAPTMQAVMAMQVTRPAPPVAAVRPDTPRRLADAIDRCLRKDPEERWPSGAALATALRGEDSDAASIAPQVRGFQRAADQITATLLMLVFVVPILKVAEPRHPGILAMALLLVLALAVLELVSKARAVLRDGFTHDDVRRAFDVELARRRAEIEAMRGSADEVQSKRTGGRLIAVLVGGGALVGVGINMLTDAQLGAEWQPVAVGVTVVGLALIVGGVTRMARAGGGHVESESASRLAGLWTGGLGRRLFSLAAWLNRRQRNAVIG